MTKITVNDTEINITKINDEDYICITDMLKAKDGMTDLYLVNMQTYIIRGLL